MRPATEVLEVSLTVLQALEKVGRHEFHAWPVVDSRGVTGVVALSVLQKAATDGREHRTLSDIVDPHQFPHLHADHPLSLALERMGETQLDLLPVVNRANIHKLEGIVTLQDVLSSYGFDRAHRSA
jgi:chloride channel protein, CIC family